MKKAARILSVIVLFFLAFGGLYGGWILITDPSGSTFEWSTGLLEGTPFRDFLIPGIILLVFNGLLPLLIAIFTIFKIKNYALLIMAQGGILFVWLTAEILLSSQLYSSLFHPTFYIVSVLLILCGFLLYRNN